MQLRSLPAKICRRLLTIAEDIEVGSKSSFRKEFPDCYVTVKALRKVCKTPIQVVFDVGAARGGWLRTLYGFFPEIKQAVLFEPAADSLDELRKSAIPGVKWIVNGSALGATEGSAVLRGKGASASLLSSTSLQERFFAEHMVPGTESVEVAALDAEVKRRGYPHPDMIKIDVQGLEWDVLKGGEVTLAACSWMIIEFSTVGLYSTQEPFSKMLDWLEQRGWRMIAIGYQWRSPAGQLLQFDAILTRDAPA